MTVNIFADARKTIADALAGLEANIYAYPAEAVFAPAIVIVIDEPMAEIKGIGSRLNLHANYRLQLCAAANSNLGALEKLETLVIEVLTALPHGIIVSTVTAPTVQAVGTSEYPVIEIPVSVPVSN